MTKSEKRSKQGDTVTIKVRAVCEGCNNGWMGQMEEAVRPVLLPLATSLDVQTLAPAPGRAILARWIALKVMVAEHARVNHSVTTPQLAQFKLMREIPTGTHLYLARSVSQDWRATYARHVATIALPEQLHTRPREKNASAFARSLP